MVIDAESMGAVASSERERHFTESEGEPMPVPFGQEAPPAVSERVVRTLALVGESLHSSLASLADREHLTPLQASLLIRIRSYADNGISAAELARALRLTPPTVGESVRALVDKGLVTRQRDPQDHRVYRLQCTSMGHTVAERVGDYAGHIERLVSSMTGAQQRELMGDLVQVLHGEVDKGYRPLLETCVSCRFFKPVSWDRHQYYCLGLERPIDPETIRTDCNLQRKLPGPMNT